VTSADARLREEMGRLAHDHVRVLAHATRGALGGHLRELERAFTDEYQRLAAIEYAPGERPSAVEWLLDNAHVIQDALAQVRDSLPRGFYRRLPSLTAGPDEGRPRVYALARAVIDEMGHPLELDVACASLDAYQEVAPLSIGEIWAFPALLRLVVLEGFAPAQRGAGREDDDGALDVGLGVRALRELAAADWKEFFERVSHLERLLREDPSGDYPTMDFATRDRYRHLVETLARRSSSHDELGVAQAALRLAAAASPDEPRATRDRHVGTYLLAEGRRALEAEVGFQPPLRMRLGRSLEPLAPIVYLLAHAGLWLPVMALPLLALRSLDEPWTVMAAATLLTAVPAWSLVTTVIDWLVTMVVPPRALPRMDPADGVNLEARTMVVVPVILWDVGDVAEVLERLEVNFLGNRQPNLSFALLTDLADANTRRHPGDEAVLEAAGAGIRALNARHGIPGHAPFHLLHRERRWNPVERVWMGWERKRGKLEEFNALVSGSATTSFAHTVDLPDDLRAVRYVITLDADTRLPPGSASELVAAFRHPLNRPVIDPVSGDLLAGFTVLQPRLATDPAVASATGFARAMTGETGVDLYAQVVSNVHHDVFGQATFMGKGIYDLAAFERRLRGRVPENRLLSHDLLEGVLGRVGLVSDAVLFERVPSNALQYASRLHRWVRGDWQLLPWLLSRRPPRQPGRIPDGLSLLDRWQIADNLRRSLHLPSLVGLLVGGWVLLPQGAAAIASLLALTVLGAPIALSALAAVRRGVTGRVLRPIVEASANAARQEAARWAVTAMLMAYLSMVTLDAVGRTLYRVYVSHRGLLEWTTAAHAAQAVGDVVSVRQAYRSMLVATVPAAALLALVGVLAPASLPVALPILVAWALAPVLVAVTSRASPRSRRPLTQDQRRSLRLLARRTWHFFASHVGPRDHWLPPDHFQEAPGAVVAHRTSPTNVGMMFLSTLAAYDLGFLDARTLATRVRETLDTLGALQRHRGHWLNWYATDELEPLEPRYVSTVDSGNLAVALLVLARGLEEARRGRVPHPRRLHGLADTVAVLGEAAGALHSRLASRDVRRSVATLLQEIDGLESELHSARSGTLAERRAAVAHVQAELEQIATAIVTVLEAAPEEAPFAVVAELRAWVDLALSESRDAISEVDATVPWLPLVREPPSLYSGVDEHVFGDSLRYLTDALSEQRDLADIEEVAARGRSLIADLDARLDAVEPSGAVAAAQRWNAAVLEALDTALVRYRELDAELEGQAGRCREAATGMDFAFLYDPTRDLFRIGYHVGTGEPDPNHYDLLASEARTASLLAIAKGDAPLEHWLQLGRPLARVSGSRVLLSWSATMFEYLMPLLVLRHPERTLLGESCRGAVEQQIAFAERHGVPWGISESAFFDLGVQGDYQYRAFGVPRLGLKRDLGSHLVIAPYASLLALPLRPRQVMANLERLTALGALGRFGFIDAVDFGLAGASAPRRARLVRTYMAHHQGMILVAIANQLLDDTMVERLHAEPEIASVALLLHEQVPTTVAPPARWRRAEAAAAEPGVLPAAAEAAWEVAARDGIARLMPLSNGAMSTLARAAGGGASRWGDVVLTRDRPHEAGGPRGTTVYLRDVDSSELWSTTLDPTGDDPGECAVTFAPHRVSYRRRHGHVVSRDEVVIADRDYVEVRRVSVTNESDRPRRLAVISYAEVVLGSAGEDDRHPAFGKLFIETEYREDLRALVFRRRRRAPEEPAPVLVHRLLSIPGAAVTVTPTVDRRAFLGRGGSLRAPRWPPPSRPTTASQRPETLDPIMSLTCVLELAPGASRQLTFVTGTGWSETAVLDTLRRYASTTRIDDLVERARLAASAELRQLGIAAHELPVAADLLALACSPRAPLRRGLGEAGPVLPVLWSHGISGDLPIVLVRIDDPAGLPLVSQVLRAHGWWRSAQVGVDVVVLDEVSSGYAQPLRERLEQAVADVAKVGRTQGPGRAIVLHAERVGGGRKELLAAASVVLDAVGPSLPEQLAVASAATAPLPAFVPFPGPLPPPREVPSLARPEGLLLDNGLGGFADDGPDGSDYVVHLEPGQTPPAPWINVVANERFGFLVSEGGASCTWAENSGERRLTPWGNDPVRDPSGEALYLRDEETGEVWSPTPTPAPAAAAYQVRHGAGVTRFRHTSHGLEQEVAMFVDEAASVKLVTLRLRDRWDRPRRVTFTCYVEWVLGTLRQRQAPFIVPDFDQDTGALLARTLLGPMADGSEAFLVGSGPPHGLTTDRSEFLGQDADPARPAGLQRVGLSGTVQGGADPCAALQLHVDLPPGGETELHIALGVGADRDEALALARRFRDPAVARASLERVRASWRERLGGVRVHTPDPGIDQLLNHWLPYQALACRLWGRTALYQSSGAFGFRDQLQDAVNLLPLEPALARAQLLRAAARQFEEGDVLHWWHPDSGAGVRTRCSDDLLWLPWACQRYLERTGDASVLEERVPFLRAPPLGEGEVERFDHYLAGDEHGTLLEHCWRAIERGDTSGPHGLPLIGSGDWNDGMNRLGLRGRGESVWLGWFLCSVLADGAALSERVGDSGRAERYRARRSELARAIERHGWDGAWYRRAFDDRGRVIGSHDRLEARIDLIAQAWAVLSGAGDEQRAHSAMAAAREHLWREDDGLLLLLAPPFEREAPDPGYIRAYPPGVRENGGQYTHGAVWGAWALADLGDGDAAVALLRSLSGVGHASRPAGVERYRVEPYVVAADVYGAPPRVGRGGWTWYTGAAGWLYRLGVERVLGLRLRADRLEVDPCIARDWPGFQVELRVGEAHYEVTVDNPDGVCRGVRDLRLDGRSRPLDDGGGASVPLLAGRHRVEVTLGVRAPAPTGERGRASPSPRRD
jgi:cyclic beta-1,2-glucan synthetase